MRDGVGGKPLTVCLTFFFIFKSCDSVPFLRKTFKIFLKIRSTLPRCEMVSYTRWAVSLVAKESVLPTSSEHLSQ